MPQKNPPNQNRKKSQGKASKNNPTQNRKVGKKIAVYGVIIIAIFFTALMGSSLASVSGEVNSMYIVSSSPKSSEPIVSESVEPVVLGPYDEEAMPMLLNKDNPLPEGYTPELVEVGYGNGKEQTMETRAGAAFIAMKEAAAAEGITLTPFSCYRSNEHQVTNYNNSVQSYVAQGYSEEKAIELTEQYFAVPGTSEHEAGFAVDIDSIEESFENTPAFTWLQQHCAEYGFILRYGKETEPITGIAYEPWHYRYVGANHAKIIQEKGITLEEYVQQANETEA